MSENWYSDLVGLVETSTNNNPRDECYTPHDIINRARECMGSIDLDPASCATANQVVRAETYYDKNSDGLTKRWFGNVWLNPPFTATLIRPFINKLWESRSDIHQAIVLVPPYVDTDWAARLRQMANIVCMPRSRVEFWSNQRTLSTGAKQGHILYGIGLVDELLFVDCFSPIGDIQFTQIRVAQCESLTKFKSELIKLIITGDQP